MSETGGGEIPTNKQGFLERMAALAKAARPETEGEKLRRLAQQINNSNPTTNALERLRIENTTSNTNTDTDTDTDKRSSSLRTITYKKNRVAIKNELRTLDDQRRYENANRKPKIIKAGTYRMGQKSILVGGDPKPKTSASIDRTPPPLDVPIIKDNSKPSISLVELEPKPDIEPLPDVITARLQAKQDKTS